MTSTLWGPQTLARVNETDDRDRASDRRSRYGVYLSQRGEQLHEYGEPDTPLPAGEFAVAAWSIATSPIMSPGYVQWRPDLAAVTIDADDDGQLFVTVTLPLRHHLLNHQRAIRYPWQDWQTDRYAYREDYPALCEPPGTRPAVLAAASVRVPVTGDWQLPSPQHTRGIGLTADAKAAVDALSWGLNQHAGPMVAALLGEV